MSGGGLSWQVTLTLHPVASAKPDGDTDVLVWDDPRQPAQLGALVAEDAERWS